MFSLHQCPGARSFHGGVANNATSSALVIGAPESGFTSTLTSAYGEPNGDPVIDARYPEPLTRLLSLHPFDCRTLTPAMMDADQFSRLGYGRRLIVPSVAIHHPLQVDEFMEQCQLLVRARESLWKVGVLFPQDADPCHLCSTFDLDVPEGILVEFPDSDDFY